MAWGKSTKQRRAAARRRDAVRATGAWARKVFLEVLMGAATQYIYEDAEMLLGCPQGHEGRN